MIKKEVQCYDLTMAQELCKQGYKITYVKLCHTGSIIFCFEDVGGVRQALDKLIEAKRAYNLRKKTLPPFPNEYDYD